MIFKVLSNTYHSMILSFYDRPCTTSIGSLENEGEVKGMQRNAVLNKKH